MIHVLILEEEYEDIEMFAYKSEEEAFKHGEAWVHMLYNLKNEFGTEIIPENTTRSYSIYHLNIQDTYVQ